jgi:hypothetical protein
MSAPNDGAIDVVRWTFALEPDRQGPVRDLLVDHGAEVHSVGEWIVALWDEADPAELDGVVEELWELHGAPFEVTHEEFKRLDRFVYHHEDDAAESAAA